MGKKDEKMIETILLNLQKTIQNKNFLILKLDFQKLYINKVQRKQYKNPLFMKRKNQPSLKLQIYHEEKLLISQNKEINLKK